MYGQLYSLKMILLFTAAIALACRGSATAEDFDGWNLEPGVQKAQLIMVARVTRISRVAVVELRSRATRGQQESTRETTSGH